MCPLHLQYLFGGLLAFMPTQNNSKTPHVCAALCKLIGQTLRLLVEWVVVENTCRALHTALILDFPRLRTAFHTG